VYVLSELVSQIDSDDLQADVYGPTRRDIITEYDNDVLVFNELMDTVDVKVNTSPAAESTLFQVKGNDA